MKKYFKFFSVLLITTILITCYIDSTIELDDKNNSSHHIALAKTNEVSVLKGELNYIVDKQIPTINKYIGDISFNDKIDMLNDYIDANDFENSITTLSEIKSKINENMDIIKNNFKLELQSEIVKANGLTDDYLEKLIYDANALISSEDFDTVTSKINIISHKISNLLYSNGQASTVEPLIIDGILIVNKNFGLPKEYGDGLKDEVSKAFEEMNNAAIGDGLHLTIASGFRDYNKQQGLFQSYIANYGDEAIRFSSPAGYSEHQSGLAIDIGGVDTSVWVTSDFFNTAEFEWLKNNCSKYGFILRYPDGKEDITGYMFESWHFRYVGTELSTYLTESNLTLEEYFGL